MLAKKIRHLLNGGAAAAGVDGLRAAIDAIAAEVAVHKAELGQIPKLRGETALADDAEAQCAALTARETHLYSAIEVAEIRIEKLRAKLAERINFRRLDRIEHHRREAREKFEALRHALLAAVEANEAASQAYAAAAAELGAHDAFLLVSRADYLPPGAVVRDGIVHWASVVSRELQGAATTAPRSPAAKPIAAVPVKNDATDLIAHGAPGKGPAHRFNLHLAAPQSAKPPQTAGASKISRPAPAAIPAPPPPALPKADADGNISIVVMRRGAEIAGKGRRPGEQIKVPLADAEAAVRAGLADFTGEAAQ